MVNFGMFGLKNTGILVIFCLLCLISSLEAAVYGPVCSSYQDPPPGGYKKWSDSSIWPKGIVPGINGHRGYVVIPCNVGVILDVSIDVQQLVINGTLKVEGKGPYVVTAYFVIVQGRLLIGTKTTPYTGKVTFNLVYGGYTYGWNRNEGSGNAGIKAFVILGGSVVLNGGYGRNRPWTTLSRTASKGATSVSVVGDVSAWPVGAKIAIASTDYDMSQAETRTIKAVKYANGVTTLTLRSSLSYMHWGSRIATGVKGVTMSESAEVALLDRSIVIQGSPATDTTGGHFVVFQTQAAQTIIGVEFVHMGQPGSEGRYPINFHLCGNVKGSLVQYNSIHQAYQRCIVLQGSWHAKIDGNVAYDTYGHCYYLEDGIEYGNTFSNNLGIYTRPALKLIVKQTNALNTDNYPATFYISNPSNSFVDNVAAGSADSGFWFQLNNEVRGPSAANPAAKGVYPILLPLGTFSGNVAHSNGRSGLKFYPGGYRPRNYSKSSSSNPLLAKPATATILNFRAYKNIKQGAFLNMSDSITFKGGFFADNRINSIEIHEAQHITVQDTVILGLTPNVGNPSGCGNTSDLYSNCDPLIGCSLPVNPQNARSLGLMKGGTVPRSVPIFGIWLSQIPFPPTSGLTDNVHLTTASLPNKLNGVKFGLFTHTSCRAMAAITANGVASNMFLSSHSSAGLTFTDSSPRVYMAPQSGSLGLIAGSPALVAPGLATLVNGGIEANFYVFRDLDGTLVGGKGGYAVANVGEMLPGSSARSPACQGVVRGTYGWLCPNTCYRSMTLDSGKGSAPRIQITNTENSASLSVRGSAVTVLNLRANAFQVFSFSPQPQFVTLAFADPAGCSGSMSLGFKAPSNHHWFMTLVQAVRPCASRVVGDPSCVVSTGVYCNSTDILNVQIGGNSRSNVVLELRSGRYKGCV